MINRTPLRFNLPYAWARPSSGVALLSVLFILVFISVFAAYMVESDYLSLRKVQNLRDSEYAYHLALGSEQWSARVLQRDMQSSDTDHLGETWHNLGTAVTVDQGQLITKIEDAQARFNINNLIYRDAKWLATFKNLLILHDIDENLAEAVADWIDADSNQTHPAGAEDTEYMLQDPPYRAANRVITNIGELLFVKGFDEVIVKKIAPFITALPTKNPTLINVNTCGAEILQSLGISPDDSLALIEKRTEQPFESSAEFLARPELAGEVQANIPSLITLSSQFFEVISQVEYGRSRQALHSLVARQSDMNTVKVIERRRQFQ